MESHRTVLGERTAPETGRGPSGWVLRFTRTERVSHWVQAITFLLLLATGLLISITPLEGLVGHRAVLREIHLISAFFFVFGPTLVALAGNRRAFGRSAREVDEWTRDDAAWLLRPAVEPEPWTPPQGKFNAGQKLNAIFTLYATFAFALTGLILWQNRRFPFAVVSQANTIHTDLTYLALLIFLGHFYLAAVHPATRHALHSMIFGTVRRDWAGYHHPLWRATSDREAPLRLAPLAGSLVLLALGMEVVLLGVRFGFEWLGANTTDPVTKLIYQVSALPATLQHAATGVHSFDLAALVWGGLLVTIWLALARRRSFRGH